MTVSNTEKKAYDDDLGEEEVTHELSDLGPGCTFEEFRAAGLGILSDEEIDDLIACVHEWRQSGMA